MSKKVNESKEKDEILKELKALEETRQKAESEKDRLLKKVEKIKKRKIPYDGEGKFFKKGKLIFKKQVQGIWSHFKEGDYRRKTMLLLNFEFRKDRENLRKALEDNKMRWSPRICKMFKVFCKRYDVLPTDLFRIQPLSFGESGNITGEDKIFCRNCGGELDLLKHLPTPRNDNSKVRCPFCHQVKPFKEGYFEKKRVLIVVKKDTTLADIKEVWPEVEFWKRITFRISFEEKEPESPTNWERDYEWYKLWKFQGKSYSKIAKKELREHREKWQKYAQSKGIEWDDFINERSSGETRLEGIIRKAIARFEKNILTIA